MKTLTRLMVLAVCLAALAMPAVADASSDAVGGAREAYKKYSGVTDQTAKLREEGSAKYKSAKEAAKTEEEKKAALDELMKMYREAGEMEKVALTAFLDAFDKCDPNAFSASDEAALLETGLSQSAQRALEHDPKAAVKAWELLLAKLPKCGSANYARSTWLPIALPSTGDLDGAIKRLGEILKDVPDDNKPDVQMAIGDTRALSGDYEGAQKEYAEALKLTPEKATNNTAAGRAKAYLEMRINLIGKIAPEIDTKDWLGAEAKKLSELKGSVVIVDFWATWCGPCIGSMPGLDDYYKERKADGLLMVGVTRFYDHGYLAANMQELREGKRNGKSEQKLDKEAFARHLKQFRENTGVSYPFAVCSAEEMKSYGITGIPTMFVLDKEGRITFVAVGGMKEHLLRLAADRLLKKAPTTGN
jgi:thiol-disulfide isomerase/thioredoxin